MKQLRDATSAGMMDCKRALQETDGDFDEAVKILRERGMASAAKRADPESRDWLAPERHIVRFRVRCFASPRNDGGGVTYPPAFSRSTACQPMSRRQKPSGHWMRSTAA